MYLLIERERVCFIWLVKRNALILILNILKYIMCGIVSMFVTLFNILIRLYRQIVGIPANCAPFVAYLCLFCCERDFVLSFPDNNQANIVEHFIGWLVPGACLWLDPP